MNKIKESLAKIRQYEKASGLIVTTMGALIATMYEFLAQFFDTSRQGSSLILALPDLLIELEATLVCVLWILISYLLTTTVLVPIIGKLADRSGKCAEILFLLTGQEKTRFQFWAFSVYRLFADKWAGTRVQVPRVGYGHL
jgi:MFS family permease